MNITTPLYTDSQNSESGSRNHDEWKIRKGLSTIQVTKITQAYKYNEYSESQRFDLYKPWFVLIYKS